jgi:peptidoglycan/LPS O-acetylase OafA/YrhL
MPGDGKGPTEVEVSMAGDPGDHDRFLRSGDESGTAPEDRGFRPDIEGLRAVAVLLVVFFHVGFSALRGGFVGVDVFFVISGFVITGLLLRERNATDRTQLLAFYGRRARRILPAALLVIAVSLVATDLLVGGNSTVLAASDSRWTALFVGNFHFSHVIPNVLVSRPAPLLQFWSLAVEEQFYLVYPAFFAVLAACSRRRSLRQTLALGLTGVVVISFIASVVDTKPVQLASYYSPFTRAWELALGGLVAVSATQLEKIPSVIAAVLTWAGIVGIAVSAISFTVLTTYPGYAAALPVMSTVLVIAGGTAVPRWGAELMLRLLPLRWVGRWSYSWYLWHWPILVIAAERAHTTVLGSSVAKNSALVAFALLVAAVSYSLIENPIRHSLLLARSPGISILGGGVLVVACVALTFAF